MLSRIRLNAVLAVLVAVCAGNLAAQQTATITGRVTEDGGGGVASAQVAVTHEATGAQTGALAGSDGTYRVEGVRAGGPYTVEVIMIGYGRQSATGVTLDAGQTVTLDFSLSQEAIAFDALEVFATRAQARQTPVAFSNVSKTQLQNQLGSRDLPLILNVTPSVYSTAQGGGAGDSRINVRGFSQRHTAFMINGVPANDMENGWVYWSNWDGLGDAATDIQLQRGLSAVNLAAPSIGGTINVITDPSARSAGLSYKQEFGVGKLDDTGGWELGSNLLKETLVVNTGPLGDFAATASVVRKTGRRDVHGLRRRGGDVDRRLGLLRGHFVPAEPQQPARGLRGRRAAASRLERVQAECRKPRRGFRALAGQLRPGRTRQVPRAGTGAEPDRGSGQLQLHGGASTTAWVPVPDTGPGSTVPISTSGRTSTTSRSST